MVLVWYLFSCLQIAWHPCIGSIPGTFCGSIVPVLKMIVEFGTVSISTSAKKVLLDISRDISSQVAMADDAADVVLFLHSPVFTRKREVYSMIFYVNP